jgi:hypothetical protein
MEVRHRQCQWNVQGVNERGDAETLRELQSDPDSPRATLKAIRSECPRMRNDRAKSAIRLPKAGWFRDASPDIASAGYLYL